MNAASIYDWAAILLIINTVMNHASEKDQIYSASGTGTFSASTWLYRSKAKVIIMVLQICKEFSWNDWVEA